MSGAETGVLRPGLKASTPGGWHLVRFWGRVHGLRAQGSRFAGSVFTFCGSGFMVCGVRVHVLRMQGSGLM
eukprot:3782955-Rhodomonas_salina.1